MVNYLFVILYDIIGIRRILISVVVIFIWLFVQKRIAACAACRENVFMYPGSWIGFKSPEKNGLHIFAPSHCPHCGEPLGKNGDGEG